MAAAGTGWDAAAHRRECTIPPDQLRALNALPGWERTFQAAPLDETPDESPASSRRGPPRDERREEPERTSAFAAASPGAHARRQRAPVLSFDDEDEADEEEERALLHADALVRAGRGHADPEMADPQTRGLRGVAAADPPRAPNADAESLLQSMERDGLAMAFSPVRTRGRAAAAARAPRAAVPVRAEAETEDIAPTQAEDPEARSKADRGAAAALATLFSPVVTRASRRRARRLDAGPKAASGPITTEPELEAIAPTQAEPPGYGPGSPRDAAARVETFRSPFAGRHRRKRRDDARDDARWDAFAADAAVAPPKDGGTTKDARDREDRELVTGPSMDPSEAAAVVRAVAAAAADGPTPPPRATSAFGDQGGDAPDGREGRREGRRLFSSVPTESDPPHADATVGVDLAASLVARRFSTGKKQKRERAPLDANGGPPAPTASPAARVVPMEEAARTSSPDETAAIETATVSPVDALLAARFSGKKKRKRDAPSAARGDRKGVDALVDVDGDGRGVPWYAGGTAEKDPAERIERRTRHRERDGRGTEAPARTPRLRRTESAFAEEEFAAAIASMVSAPEARLAEAAAERARSFAEAAAAKSATARPPSSVTRAISFEDARGDEKETEAKEAPADALALFGNLAPRFRGKRRTSASAPRRTPAARASAPKTKAVDPRRSAMSLLGLGD